jgi:HAD superfamily hydrolase (TIGR01549 family)
MFKAILFDFDGTIVDSLKQIHFSWKKAFEKNNITISDEEIVRDVFYASKDERSKRYNVDIDKLHGAYLESQRNVYANLELQEHIDTVLKELKNRGVKLSIVTSGKSELSRRVIASLDLEKYFDVILCGDEVSKGKPDPEIVYTALNLMGVGPEDALIVGDSAVDIETGKNAGIHTALYLPDANAPYVNDEILRQLKPDFKFEHFSDFLRIIGQ